MDIKVKYQYSYFLYKFCVDEDKYEGYLRKLLKDSKCSLKIFDKIKDLELYTHFLPNVRDFLFPTFSFDKKDINKFNSYSINKKANILKDMSSVTFEYNLGRDVQGKAGQDSGIFFKIDKINIICFKSGVCFISIKTNVEQTDSFSDVLNFNYKFSNMSPKFFHVKDFDKIKIQTNRFNNMMELTDVLKNLVGGYESTKIKDICSDKLFTYSYACIDSNNWNEINSFENIQNEFIKYKNVLPASYSSQYNDKNDIYQNTYFRWKYSIYGFNPRSGVVFSSGIDSFNFTKLPFYYETVYFYIMLLAYYQQTLINVTKSRILAKKAIDFNRLKEELSFTKIATSEHTIVLWEKWQEKFDIKSLYEELNNLYNASDVIESRKYKLDTDILKYIAICILAIINITLDVLSYNNIIVKMLITILIIGISLMCIWNKYKSLR